jgi:hypothetical protein
MLIPLKCSGARFLTNSPISMGFIDCSLLLRKKIGIEMKQVSINHFPRKQVTSNYGLGRILNILRHVWALSNPIVLRENLSCKVKNIVQGT